MDTTRYVIGISNLPTYRKERKEIVFDYLHEIDFTNMVWKQTPIRTDARVFDLKNASDICCILNKTNKLYYLIIPIGEIQIFQSKLNKFTKHEL